MSIRLFLTFALCLSPLLAQDVLVITHPSTPVSSISLADLQAIYAGEKRVWANEAPVRISTQVKALPGFFDSVLKSKASDFKKAWLRLVLQDGAKPPSDFTSDEEVLDFVSRTRGAIGYVKAGAAIDRVKVLTVQ